MASVKKKPKAVTAQVKVAKPQRIRDPLHDLIGFATDDFEQTCWKIIQTCPFQRLRRVKQLGFSDTVYPGATHSRLAHSLGVFHTARQISAHIKLVHGTTRFNEPRSQTALAAALVHDLGHGPFSHAFEDAMARAEGTKKRHEMRTVDIIKNSEICDLLNSFRPSFADEVARMFTSKPTDIYSAIVSSQFDADRLDYMRRDRLMTGTQGSAIDFTWLIENLQIGRVPTGSDEVQTGEVETLIVGRKAAASAEAYVLSLFQLYSSVYLHKATRGMEKLFSELVAKIAQLVKAGLTKNTGLHHKHPLIRYISDSDDLERFLLLDDFVIWGAMVEMRIANDPLIRHYADRLINRKPLLCYDITAEIEKSLPISTTKTDLRERDLKIRRISTSVEKALEPLKKLQKISGLPKILEDKSQRDPYKRYAESSDALSKIWVHESDETPYDLAQLSSVVAGLRPFYRYRVYAHDQETISEVRIIAQGKLPK